MIMQGDTPVKVVTLGNSNVGKTALVTRWLEDRFDTSFNPTVGAGFQVQPVDYDGRSYQLHIWDTAGQDQYRNTTAIYCRDAKGALVTFDVTERSSFDDVENWVALISDSVNQTPFVLVGNKIDLYDKRQVSSDEADELARRLGGSYFETSALSGQGVEEAFAQLVAFACGGQRVHKPNVTDQKPAQEQAATRGVDISQQGSGSSGKKGCCG